MRLRLPCGAHCWQHYIQFYYVAPFKPACHRGIMWSDVRSIDQRHSDEPTQLRSYHRQRYPEFIPSSKR